VVVRPATIARRRPGVRPVGAAVAQRAPGSGPACARWVRRRPGWALPMRRRQFAPELPRGRAELGRGVPTWARGGR